MNDCEKCHIKHDGTYGSGRFCSIICARSFSTSAKRQEINEKVSAKLSSKHESMELPICKWCEIKPVKRRRNSYCSNSCSLKARYKNEEFHDQNSKRLSLVRKPWISRKACVPSFPEKCVGEWLDQLQISYEREFKFESWFVDFAIHSKMIALEVDGKQHSEQSRLESDSKKDAALIAAGWKVIRMRWKYLTRKNRQEMLEILRNIA